MNLSWQQSAWLGQRLQPCSAVQMVGRGCEENGNGEVWGERGEDRRLGQWGPEVRYQKVWLERGLAGRTEVGCGRAFTVTEMGQGAGTEPVVRAGMFHLNISEGPVPGVGGYKALRIAG